MRVVTESGRLRLDCEAREGLCGSGPVECLVLWRAAKAEELKLALEEWVEMEESGSVVLAVLMLRLLNAGNESCAWW